MTLALLASQRANRGDQPPLHAAPSWLSVVWEQMRTVELVSRLAAAALITSELLFSAVALWAVNDARSWNIDHPFDLKAFPQYVFSGEMGVLMVAVAFLLPLLVWQDEDPARRLYHWAMPVSRYVHALARTFAGWCWLMVATLAYVVGFELVASIAAAIAGRTAHHAVDFQAWEWVVPFTAATVAYGLVSAAVIGTRRPLVWIAGVATTFVGVVSILARLGKRDAFEEVIRAVVSGPYGIETALGRVHFYDGVLRVMSPRVEYWLGATSIWLAVGAVLLAWVSCRHTEPQ